jgi:hypothetical protein
MRAGLWRREARKNGALLSTRAQTYLVPVFSMRFPRPTHA